MARQVISLRNLKSFGDVAAEDDSVLDYFITTEAVEQLVRNERFLVLGRKGSGKTALVRYFSETPDLPTPARALKLRSYPWNVHASRKDTGASSIEVYVASWRYLIACELALLLLELVPDSKNEDAKTLRKFFSDNYGTDSPALELIIRPKKIRLSKGSLEPAVLGNQLGSISFEREASDHDFGLEVNALSNAILSAVVRLAEARGVASLLLHFDELDQGLSDLDTQRKEMLTGLVLAARDIRYQAASGYCRINPVVYLRTDIWDALEFSDKNKVTQTSVLNLEWSSDSLQELIDRRIQSKVGASGSWESLDDETLMRGSQTKWNHMLARTFLRPRDVIRFLNAALTSAKQRPDEPLIFINEDITAARDAYSRYLKEELDDEITDQATSLL